MRDKGFTPEVATGPFTMLTHGFCSGGTIAEPSVIWFDACNPGQARLGPMEEFTRAMNASLPFGSDEIGRACEALFGPPVPMERRGFPHGADWVLTTPVDGVFLIVRLPDDDLDRFGFGIEKGLQQAILDLDWVDEPEARDAAEMRVRDALLATMEAIRAVMDIAPSPAP